LTAKPPKLLDQVREVLTMKHYAYRTEQAYIDWIKRFIFFHNKRHHLEVSVVQKAVRQAARKAGINKPVSPHTFRQAVFVTAICHPLVGVRV
jgi:site-specific recombinase XerD